MSAKKKNSKIKVGHYQLECIAKDYEANILKVLNGLKAADEQNIDIISFPESFLTGYFSDGEKAKKYSWKVDGPEIKAFLARTAKFKCMFMVGFNEKRGDKLYNTVLVAEKGELKGFYSKAFPCSYFTPGREFPIFEKNGIKFGVIICADGGCIEPARILALKGAKIIFAPHYNYIHKEGLLNHYAKVRADHIARAVENTVWFMRGNNVTFGQDTGQEREGSRLWR